MIDKTVEKKLVGAKLVGHNIVLKNDFKYILLDFENDHGQPLRLTFAMDKETEISTYVRQVPPVPIKERGPSHNHTK